MNPALKGWAFVHWLPGVVVVVICFAVVFVLAPEAERFTAASAPTINKAAETTNTCLILLMSYVSSRNDRGDPPAISFLHRPGNARVTGS
jgi:hypothetical protein